MIRYEKGLVCLESGLYVILYWTKCRKVAGFLNESPHLKALLCIIIRQIKWRI